MTGSDTPIHPSESASATMLDVHRLIQDAVVHSLHDGLSEHFTGIIFLLFTVFDRPRLDYLPEKDEWRGYSQLLSHLFSMLRRYKAYKAASSDTSTPSKLLDLLWKVAW